MRVLVTGAGVAGLALARGLMADGHEVEVIEAAPELRTTGGSVTIWSGGMSILRELDVNLDGMGQRLESMEARATDGRTVSTIDLVETERRYGAPSVHVVRRELVERLAEGVPVTYGARAVEVVPEEALVRLEDGREARGDVLVGADGRRSVVRTALWGEDPATPSGWVTWQGFIQMPELGTGAMMVPGKEGFFGLTPAGGGRALWVFDVQAKPGGPLWGDDPDPIGSLKERFGGWAEPIPRILAEMESPEFFPHVKHRVPKVWGRGPTTLMGDAAHSMPPAMAQGANQALEDAWALRGSLDDLRGYERARARIAARPAFMAGMEATNKPNPLAPILSDRLMTKGYASWIRMASSYLLTR